MKKYLAYALFALTCGLSTQAHAIAVDLELSLLVDVSPSIDGGEYATQINGYEAAFQDAGVQAAIAALPGGIAVNMIFFSQNAALKINWTQLTDAASADAFAAVIAGLSRNPPVNNGTDIAEGYTAAVNSFVGNGFEGTRQTIDISGDGPQNLNNGCPAFGDGLSAPCLAQTNAARDLAVAAGIVVNGLVIGPGDPLFGPGGGVDYFEQHIITADGFALAATSFDAFAPVVRDKIFREITGGDPGVVPVTGTLALILLGLVILRNRQQAAAWR